MFKRTVLFIWAVFTAASSFVMFVPIPSLVHAVPLGPGDSGSTATPAKPVLVKPAEDMQRRQLSSLLECLESHMDTANDAKDFNDMFRDHSLDTPVVAVGLDRADEGVMNCKDILYEDVPIFNPKVTTTDDITHYILKKLTGNENFTGKVSKNTIKTNRDTWAGELRSKISSYATDSVFNYTRLSPLVQACYDITTVKTTGTNKGKDFQSKVDGTDYFFIFKKDQKYDDIKYLHKHNKTLDSDTGPFIATDSENGIGTEWNTGSFDMFTTDFFPYGRDLEYTSMSGFINNYKIDAWHVNPTDEILNCKFIYDHRGEIVDPTILVSINTESDSITYGQDANGDGKPDGPVGSVAPVSSATINGDDSANCETEGDSPLSWILCPILDGAANFSDFVFESFIVPSLDNIPISTDPTSGVFKAWSNFRILANILLLGALLVVIIGQASGKE